MRVLYCSNHYPPDFIGGAELVAHRHAVLLASEGVVVEVFAGAPVAAGTERYSLRREEFDGLRVHRIALAAEDYDWRRLNFFHPEVDRRFAQLLEEFDPQIVHLHNTTGLSLGMIHEAARRGVRVVVTVHDHWGFCMRNTLVKWDTEICGDFRRCAECMPFVLGTDDKRYPVALRRAYFEHRFEEVDLLISPSRYLAEAYIAAGFPCDRVRRVDYGADLARFSRITRTPSEAVRFSFIGYLGEHKGLLLLLRALRKLPLDLAWTLNIVGGGHLEPRVREYQLRERCGNRVRLWGRLEAHRIEEAFRETDVLVLPSRWPENQPVTILEAMASAVPVIASRLGGNPELVENGANGWLFDPESSSDLARCMCECLKSRAELESRGLAGLRRVSRMPFARQIGLLMEIYRGLVDGEPRRRPAKPLVALASPLDAHGIQPVLRFMNTAYPKLRLLPGEWIAADEWKRVAISLPGSGSTMPFLAGRHVAPKFHSEFGACVPVASAANGPWVDTSHL